MSPWLFNAYIDMLMKEIKSRTKVMGFSLRDYGDYLRCLMGWFGKEFESDGKIFYCSMQNKRSEGECS